VPMGTVMSLCFARVKVRHTATIWSRRQAQYRDSEALSDAERQNGNRMPCRCDRARAPEFG